MHQFELILGSDEEGGDNGPSSICGDDEFVPETEPQDIVAVSKARPRFGEAILSFPPILFSFW